MIRSAHATNATDVASRVTRVLATEYHVRQGERILIGVSGGTDSMVLLHMLAQFSMDRSMKLAVVHVDHQLRSESADDAAFVEHAATQLGIPVTTIAKEVRQTASDEGRSFEDAARQVRYEAFQAVATRTGATRLMLAHTADDQAETVLMRLLRGSGLTGLSGIPSRRMLDGVEILRPLLGIWRQEILAYAQAHQVAFRHDHTNDDPQFVRNRIRHQLLPLLERDYNPQIKAQLVQLAEQCRTDGAFLQASAQRQWKRLAKPQREALAIRLDVWRQQPMAIQRQLMRLAIAHVKGDLQEFEFRHWRELEEVIASRPTGTLLHLPGQVEIEKSAEYLLVRRQPNRRAPTPVGRGLALAARR